MWILSPKFGLGFVATMQGGPEKPYPYKFAHPALISLFKFSKDMLTTNNIALNSLLPSPKIRVLSVWIY